MTRRWRSRLVVAIAVVCSSLGEPALAAADAKSVLQKVPPPEERANLVTSKMKEKLALTAEQEPKVHAINLTAAKAVDAVIADAGASRYTKYQGLRSAQKQRDKDLKAIFTKEQWAGYEKLKDDLKEEAKTRIRASKGSG